MPQWFLHFDNIQKVNKKMLWLLGGDIHLSLFVNQAVLLQ